MRTPEQIKVDEELGAAIDKCHQAYGLLLPGMVRQFHEQTRMEE